jgi:hypothetical protein
MTKPKKSATKTTAPKLKATAVKVKSSIKAGVTSCLLGS